MSKAVLLSKHQKLPFIEEVLAKAGLQVSEYSQFDTDTLGTFSGEVERTLSPKECALTKAQKACEVAQVEVGLGSEGSFGGGPMPGLLNWNSEILCYYDKRQNLAIYASAEGPTPLTEISTDTLDELQQQLAKFPGQRWIYRAKSHIHKALLPEAVLEIAQANPAPWRFEPDMRAMHCPHRQTMITKAAIDLTNRLSAICPKCQQPDFVVKKVETGLPCELCQFPTNSVQKQIKICSHCHYEEHVPAAQPVASASTCPMCNP